MRNIALSIAAAFAISSSAFAASSISGVPTSVEIYNSGWSGYACNIIIAGRSIYLDDVSGNFNSSCLGAAIARVNGRSITISYNISGGINYAVGIYSSNTASYVDYIYTNDYTGSSSADNCKGQLNLVAGTNWYYVDDGGPEDDSTCAALFLAQYYGSSFSINYDTNTREIRSLQLR